MASPCRSTGLLLGTGRSRLRLTRHDGHDRVAAGVGAPRSLPAACERAMSIRHFSTHSLRSAARVALVAVLGLALLTVTDQGAAGATRTVTAVATHPFSSPVWWPMRTSTLLGWVRTNPGCNNSTDHKSWAMNIVSRVRTVANPLEPVHAMGAGIVHYARRVSTVTGQVDGATTSTSSTATGSCRTTAISAPSR